MEDDLKNWDDCPINSSSEDLLDRKHFAKKVARFISLTSTTDNSIVYGLTGPWGAGKSSIIAMISEILSRVGTRWKVAHFTPWAASDSDGILTEFYTTLENLIPNSRKMRRLLAELLLVSAEGVSIAAQAVEGFGISMTIGSVAQSLSRKQSWQTLYERVSAELQKANPFRYLIVIDDIDRLQHDELMTLFKVLRLLGRFPRIHFLIAYDERSISEIMSGGPLNSRVETQSTSRFLEKIVQYPIAVPPMADYERLALIEEFLKGLQRQRDVFGGEKALPPANSSGTVLKDLANEFLELLRTPRALKRFFVQLTRNELFYEVNRSAGYEEREINFDDSTVLCLIQLQAGVVFTEIPNFKERLLGLCHSDDSEKIKQGDMVIDELTQSLDSTSKEPIQSLLDWLFRSPFRRDKSVSDDAYFDRYFQYTVPGNDVSDAKVWTAVHLCVGGESLTLTRMLEDQNPVIRSVVLKKLSRICNPSAGHITSEQFFVSVMPILAVALGGEPHTADGRSATKMICEAFGAISDSDSISAIMDSLMEVESTYLAVDALGVLIHENSENSEPFISRPLGSHGWYQVISPSLIRRFIEEEVKPRILVPREESIDALHHRSLILVKLLEATGQLVGSLEQLMQESKIDGGDIAARCLKNPMSLGGPNWLEGRATFEVDLYESLVREEFRSWVQEAGTKIVVPSQILTWNDMRVYVAKELRD